MEDEKMRDASKYKKGAISVIVITKDEAHSIRKCLDTVRWADEIVVVDSGSGDGTVEICFEYTNKVFVTDWPGFGAQKNRALALSSGEWVLSLDADERIGEDLREEIQTAVSKPGSHVGFRMPRLSSYCGRFIRHSGWWPDYVLRLFHRDYGRFTDDPVHERVIVDGPVGTLKKPIVHESFRDLEDVLNKMNKYSTYGAQMMMGKNRKASLYTAVAHGLWSFIHTYVIRAGFLDGREGFMLAVSNAEGTYYRYLKLMLLNDKKTPSRTTSYPL